MYDLNEKNRKSADKWREHEEKISKALSVLE